MCAGETIDLRDQTRLVDFLLGTISINGPFQVDRDIKCEKIKVVSSKDYLTWYAGLSCCSLCCALCPKGSQRELGNPLGCFFVRGTQPSGRLLCALPFALARRALGSRSSLGTAHSPLVGFFVLCPKGTAHSPGVVLWTPARAPTLRFLFFSFKDFFALQRLCPLLGFSCVGT